MGIHRADTFLKKADEAVGKDGGNSYRKWLGKVIPHIGDAYREDESSFRSHLGASQIGEECPRKIWYGFRWYAKRNFTGKQIRLFNRGHLEEARFIAILLAMGIKVSQQDSAGNQYRINKFGGHFGGSGDGVAFDLPDFEEGSITLLEFKTSNDRNFKKLKKEGVRRSKHVHYVQMQIYLHEMGIPYALYMCVNKNDDELYAEYVAYDPETAIEYLDRAEEIINSPHPPARTSTNMAWFTCKFCDYRLICHDEEEVNVNCRSCASSYPRDDGEWICLKKNEARSKDDQLAACSQWVRIQED